MKQSLPGVRILVPLFLSLVFLLPAARSMELDYYGIESSINDDSMVSTVLTMRFSDPVNSSEFSLGYKASNLTAASSFDSADCRLSQSGTDISCSFTGMTDSKNLLTLKFITREGFSGFGGKFNFSSDYGISAPAKEAFVLVKIPKSSTLSEEPANQSYSPRDGKILSDGKQIMVYWQKENLTAADDMRFSVSYSIPALGPIYSNMLIVSVSGIVIISMIAVAIYVRRGSLPEKLAADVVTSVLNKDEKRVVDILARHGGRSGQKIIVRESDFSKAKVSRLVKNLRDRGVVDIEPISGRENRIILKFDKKPESEQKPEQKPERIADPVIETQADVENI